MLPKPSTRLLLGTLALAVPLLAQAGVTRVGEENWQKPWLPDLARPGKKVWIPLERRIDVVILGDGYLQEEGERFARDVRRWYERFLLLTPWQQLRGAFRVRGLFTPSPARSTARPDTAFRVPTNAWKLAQVESKATSAAIYEALEKIGVNQNLGRAVLSHCYVIMLVLDSRGRNPSGKSRQLRSPDGKRLVRVGFGAYTHHEFGHAYGRLSDEYILEADSVASPRRGHGSAPSAFFPRNISFSDQRDRIPWAHLMPGTAINPDEDSVIGVLWLGGVQEKGAWHCEARCLMNGRHDNWDLQKEKRGANLRHMQRYCFWCEELLVARTLALTGQLGKSQDGRVLWRNWEENLRPLYQKTFEVEKRIRAENVKNRRENLSKARIYLRPVAEKRPKGQDSEPDRTEAKTRRTP